MFFRLVIMTSPPTIVSLCQERHALPIDSDPPFDSAAFHAVIGRVLAERFGAEGWLTHRPDLYLAFLSGYIRICWKVCNAL